MKETGSVGCIEFLVVHLEKIQLTLITIYRPPTSKSIDFNVVMQRIKSTLQNLNPTPRLILTGDLNFPSLNWEQLRIESCARETREQAQVLLNFLEENFMEQYVEEATRVNNMLDIFSTNDHELVSNISIENTEQRISDHRMMNIRTRICVETSNDKSNPSNQCMLASLNFWSPNIDWNKMKTEFLTCNWNEFLDAPDIDSMAESLLRCIEEICLKYVPYKVDRKKSNIPRDRRVLMRKRKKLRSKLLSGRNIRVIENIEKKLEDIEKELISSHELQQIREELVAVEKIQNNSKYF